MKRYAVSSFIPDPAARYWCFHWPESGPAVREDVIRGMPEPDYCKVFSLPCQQPVHLHWQDHAHWVVLEIDENDFLEREGQVEFRQGNVVFRGSPQDACQFLEERGLPVPCSLRDVKVGGDWDRVIAGDSGIAIAGWASRAEVGDHGLAYARNGTSIAGQHGVAVSDFGEAVSGDHGVSAAIYGHASAGDFGIAVACNEFQTAEAGERGLAIAAFGHSGGGIAIAGKHGIAFTQGGGATGVVQAGEGGILTMEWHDGWRWRLAVAYVGEGGIQADVPYRLAEDGSLILAMPGPSSEVS